MNINQAKEDIKNAIRIYLKKDEYGDYRIPVVRQRPIFLLGAPGIGKTAIMEQIAQELSIALVSYSMTHHTRQSALGLPFIQKKTYGTMTADVSEYTMSEIIASIYDTMEQSGVKEGILFLDEINCVSETLAPSMLQFLQYKVFGKHAVPNGWVIVTAGNPPQYNKSVREFDVVTMDRLKVLSVEADYETWKRYARERGIHTAILNFLDIKKEFFYHMETTVKGRAYVTARGWEDLSEIIIMYEEDGLSVDEALVGQYLQSEQIVKEFCAYYDLYQKYKNEYRVADILMGNIFDETVKKAKQAPFDERLSLLGLLLDKVTLAMKEVMDANQYLTSLHGVLIRVKECEDVVTSLSQEINQLEKMLHARQSANALSKKEKQKGKRCIRFLSNCKQSILEQAITNKEEAFLLCKQTFESEVEDMKNKVGVTSSMLKNLFAFAQLAFAEGNEMLILVTELTVNDDSAGFISTFGSEEYQKYNKLLMLSERQLVMKQAIEELTLVSPNESV